MKKIFLLLLVTAFNHYCLGMQPGALFGAGAAGAAGAPPAAPIGAPSINDLTIAIAQGNAQRVQQIIGQNIGLLNQLDRRGFTPLHAAVDIAFQLRPRAGDIIQTLSDAGARTNIAANIGNVNYPTLGDYIDARKATAAYQTNKQAIDGHLVRLPNQVLAKPAAGAARPRADNDPAAAAPQPVVVAPVPLAQVAPPAVAPAPVKIPAVARPDVELNQFITAAYHGSARCQGLYDQDNGLINRVLHGKTALHAAVEGAFAGVNKTENFVQLLIRLGADPQARVYGREMPDFVNQRIAANIARWNAAAAGENEADVNWRNTVENVCYPLLAKTNPVVRPQPIPAPPPAAAQDRAARIARLAAANQANDPLAPVVPPVPAPGAPNAPAAPQPAPVQARAARLAALAAANQPVNAPGPIVPPVPPVPQPGPGNAPQPQPQVGVGGGGVVNPPFMGGQQPQQQGQQGVNGRNLITFLSAKKWRLLSLFGVTGMALFGLLVKKNNPGMEFFGKNGLIRFPR